MKSWVTIKRGKQVSKVPYQAFKDVFEKDGFILIDETNLNTSPTFSNSLNGLVDKTETNLVDELENSQKEVSITDERDTKKSNSKRNKSKV